MNISHEINLAMENDTCHFCGMDDSLSQPGPAQQRVGRPRRGTEATRRDLLFSAATQVFLREGYGAASIDKVACEAGVSTRTIYERFKNKAELLAAVIARLVDRDMEAVLETADGLDALAPREALMTIGREITGRACNADSAALFRILATEAQRFPELAAKMRCANKVRIDNALAKYFRAQVSRGTLQLADADRAAALFIQMVVAELHECVLFRSADDMAMLDHAAHLNTVVDIFLNGVTPRGTP